MHILILSQYLAGLVSQKGMFQRNASLIRCVFILTQVFSFHRIS